MMQKLLKVYLCTLAFVVAAPANATKFIMFNGSTGVFGNDLVSSPTFNDAINLGPLGPGQFLISATISSSYQAGNQADQDIDFTSVSLNNTPFSIGSSGQFEYRFINNVFSGAQNLFSISGIAGSGASYAGTVNIAPIPEPRSWAMFMIGFAVIGCSMRRLSFARTRLRQLL